MNTRKTYMDSQFSRNAITLLPGDFKVINDDSMMVTVLGSCVSVYLIDIQAKIAGLNHYLLPESSGTIAEKDVGRYGTSALKTLLDEMMKAGARKDRIQAKVFGGAKVIDANIDIGQRNILQAEAFLKEHNIPITARSVGGSKAIKVYSFADSDGVYIRKVTDSQSKSICLDQLKLGQQLPDNPFKSPAFLGKRNDTESGKRPGFKGVFSGNG